MFDKREAILERMLETLGTVDGPVVVEGNKSVFRNRVELPPEKLPALVLLDGREEMSLSTSGHGGAIVPTTFNLQPQVFIVLKPRVDINNEGIGEELSAWRMRVLKAIIGDESLRGLLGANGEIVYLSSETDMQAGSSLLGYMRLEFQLSYVLDPKDL